MLAHSYVTAWLGEHEDTAGRIGLRTIRDTREKYGRYLADLYDLGDADVPALSSALVSSGNAVPYHPR